MASILIRGGRLLSPADKLDAKLDLRIENGVITEIGPRLTSKLKGSADTILDARGQVVAPGFVETSMLDGLSPDRKEELMKTLPVRRFGQPDEIAHAVSFVTSDLAGYFTGQVLVVDGGLAR